MKSILSGAVISEIIVAYKFLKVYNINVCGWILEFIVYYSEDSTFYIYFFCLKSKE